MVESTLSQLVTLMKEVFDYDIKLNVKDPIVDKALQPLIPNISARYEMVKLGNG